MFFGTREESSSERCEREAQAKLVCASCPVLHACRTYALDMREPLGVWGGLTETNVDNVWSKTHPDRTHRQLCAVERHV